MGNLGIHCDLKSCYMCDTCIYDDDYQDTAMEEIKTKRTNCDGCPFISKLRVSTGTSNYYNLYCTKKEDGVKKLIDISVPENKLTPTPCWCTYNKEIENEKKIVLGGVTLEKKGWGSIEPQIKFEDIKEGDVYHVSPYDNHGRMDIVITHKSDYSASYKILNENERGFNINTIYPNTMMMRYLSKHKVQQIEVKQKI